MFSPVNWPSSSINDPNRNSPAAAAAERPYSATPTQLGGQSFREQMGSPFVPTNLGNFYDYPQGVLLGSLSGEVRHSREVLLTDLQAQLQCSSEQLRQCRSQLQERTMRVAELEKSINEFWNPELRKERVARKEESTQLLAVKDNCRQLMDENHFLQETIRNLTAENNVLKRKRHVALDDANQSSQQYEDSMGAKPLLGGVDDGYEDFKAELDQKSKEIFLLKKTLQEMELRIETQKQTLRAKDQSIQKLLEMVQTKGFLVKDAELSHQNGFSSETAFNEKSQNLLNQASIDLESRLKSPPPNQEPTALAIKHLLESKDERITSLEKQLKLTGLSGTSRNADGSAGQADDSFKEHLNFLKAKLDQVRIENSEKDTELLALQSKNELLMKQTADQNQHINVLKEALFTKEQKAMSIQREMDSLRGKVEDKEIMLQRSKLGGISSADYKDSSQEDMSLQIMEMQRTIKDLRNQVEQWKVLANQNRLAASTHNELQSAFGDREKLLHQLHADKEKDKSSFDHSVDMYSRLHEDVNRKNQELNEDNQIKSRAVREHEEKVSSLLTANMKKDSALKSLEISLAQKTEELVEFEQRIRRLQEEKILLMREKQELNKKVEALEEQVNHYIDELTRTQSILDRSSEQTRELEEERRVHERRVAELEGVISHLKAKLNDMRRSKNDENAMQQRLLNDARKREGDVIQDAAGLQEVLMEKDRRIGELEQALDETARMASAREAVVSKHSSVTSAAHGKVDDLVHQVERLQRALRTSDSKLAQMASHLSENEAKVQQMQSERKRQLADVMQMKQEALTAALAEKNAHIALLENSSAQTPAIGRDLNKLQAEKEQLVRRLNEHNEKRLSLLQSLNSKVGGASGSRRGGAPPSGSRPGSRAHSVIEEEAEENESHVNGPDTEAEGVWA